MKSNKESSKTEDDKKERNRTSYSELPDDDDSSSSKPVKKEAKSTKDVKESWVFRKSRASKTEKSDPDRFRGDGVNFKAKIIGIEVVFDARGNRMCQDTLQKLKAAVKTSGEHKQRIVLNISLMGIRIKDEKSGEVLHHHPVHKISFISQDASDSRAFGYVYGCPQTGHQFFGIKTEKTAAQVVYTLRDLFHTALELKKEEIAKAMKLQKEEEEENSGKNQTNEQKAQENGISGGIVDVQENGENHIVQEQKYMEWSPGSGDKAIDSTIPLNSNHENVQEGCVVDNLLDLQFEMDSLQQGITQMDYTIASASSVGFGMSFSEEDNSSGCSFPMTPRKLNRVSSLYHETLSISSRSSSTSDYAAYSQDPVAENFGAFKNDAFVMASCATPPPAQENPEPLVEDKYAVFYEIDNLTSIFDNPSLHGAPEMKESSFITECFTEMPEASFGLNHPESYSELKPVPSLFAELDPLGNQPYVEKENFFQELKNSQKVPNFGDGCDSTVPSFDLGTNTHLNPVEMSVIVQEKSNNPFAYGPVSPPKLPPKRSFSVSSTLPASTVKRLENVSINDAWPVKNPFNPFTFSDDIPDIPPPNSPPPPPPPRLPMKDSEPPMPVSPPPRPPSRTSAAPTPPRPRRKVPFGATSSTWFSFDQEAISSAAAHSQPSWDNMPLSPPLPAPLRKLSSNSKYESPVHKSCSASNSPSSARRTSSLGFSTENNSILNGTVSPGRKMMVSQSTVIQDWEEPKSEAPTLKNNPFTESNFVAESSGSDCSEVKQILNRSPPLPPKSSSISRPRPSPSRKMLAAPAAGSCSSSTSSSLSSKNESTSSSLRYSSLDESHSNQGSASDALCTSSFSSRTDETFSSGYNGEVSAISSENSIEKMSPTSPDSIFRRKSDPFADDFFLSLPKKSTASSSLSNGIEEQSGYTNGFSTDCDRAKAQ